MSPWNAHNSSVFFSKTSFLCNDVIWWCDLCNCRFFLTRQRFFLIIKIKTLYVFATSFSSSPSLMNLKVFILKKFSFRWVKYCRRFIYLHSSDQYFIIKFIMVMFYTRRSVISVLACKTGFVGSNPFQHGILWRCPDELFSCPTWTHQLDKLQLPH